MSNGCVPFIIAGTTMPQHEIDFPKLMQQYMYQRVTVKVPSPEHMPAARRAVTEAFFEQAPGSEIKFVVREQTDTDLVFLIPSDEARKLDRKAFAARLAELL